MASFWRNYKERFAPFLARKLRSRQTKVVTKADEAAAVDEEDLLGALIDAASKLSSCLHGPIDPRKAVREGWLKRSYEANCKAVERSWGYYVERKKSSIENCGRGVFLAGGSAPPGKLVCLYPGTIYRPGDAILLQSLGNSFVLRCLDGVLIDGSDRGLSAGVFRSCVARDRFHPYRHAADLSWLTSYPEVPFNVGQYVNNGGEGHSNVAYRELTVEPGRTFPIDLLHFLPNIPFVASSNYVCPESPSTTSHPTSSTSQPGHPHGQQPPGGGGYLPPRRLVALVTTRHVEPGEELLSSYFTVVTS